MMIFKDTVSGKRVATNRKVMSSFFELNPRFIRVGDDQAEYFIVRNPYARVVSMFQDKIVEHCHEPRQDCHTRLMDAFGIPFETLNGMSFRCFCFALAKVRDLDPHFWCQVHEAFGVLDGAQMVQMETGLPALSDALGIYFGPRQNATSHADWPSFYTPLTQNLVATIYAPDFKVLGYPTQLK